MFAETKALPAVSEEWQGREVSDDYGFVPGTMVRGRYEVVETLGAGGFGLVVRARDMEDGGRSVALKFPRSVRNAKVALSMFSNEAKNLRALRHPRVVRIIDSFVVDDRWPCMVLEYVEGRTLESMGADQDVPRSELIAPFIDICRALTHMHSAGAVHRDVKPENMLYRPTSTGSAEGVLIDLGIALLRKDLQSLSHGPGVVAGTKVYMSPEAFFPDPRWITPRLDIFALGISLSRVLFGAIPGGEELAGLSFEEVGTTRAVASIPRFGSSSATFRTQSAG